MGVFIRGWAPTRTRWRDVHQVERVVTAPAAEPVTVQEAKSYLRVPELDTDDLEIERLIRTARRQVERDTNSSLFNTVWDYAFDAFPCDGVLPLPRGPVVSVTSVTSYDTAGVSAVLDTDQYTVDTMSGRLFLAEDGVWPTDIRLQWAGVVRYTAGYGTDAETVPEELLLAIKLLVTHWWEERRMVNTESGSTVVPAIPFGYDVLIGGYRSVVVA